MTLHDLIERIKATPVWKLVLIIILLAFIASIPGSIRSGQRDASQAIERQDGGR